MSDVFGFGSGYMPGEMGPQTGAPAFGKSQPYDAVSGGPSIGSPNQGGAPDQRFNVDFDAEEYKYNERGGIEDLVGRGFGQIQSERGSLDAMSSLDKMVMDTFTKDSLSKSTGKGYKTAGGGYYDAWTLENRLKRGNTLDLGSDQEFGTPGQAMGTWVRTDQRKKDNLEQANTYSGAIANMSYEDLRKYMNADPGLKNTMANFKQIGGNMPGESGQIYQSAYNDLFSRSQRQGLL